jgi:hypothetical protein
MLAVSISVSSSGLGAMKKDASRTRAWIPQIELLPWKA